MTSFIAPETSRRVTRIPDCHPRTPERAHRDMRRQKTALSTLEEERREVLASVLLSLATEAPDPDRTAACFRLLEHLNRAAARN